MFASKEGQEAARALAKFSGLGCSLAAGVAFFAWVGYQLDRWWGTAPVGLAVMCLVGAGLGLYKVVRDVIRWSAEDDRRTHAR